MSMPGEGQSSGPIGSVYDHLKKVLGTYRRIKFKRKEYAVDLMNAVSL